METQVKYIGYWGVRTKVFQISRLVRVFLDLECKCVDGVEQDYVTYDVDADHYRVVDRVYL